jgi:hypothetical protein
MAHGYNWYTFTVNGGQYILSIIVKTIQTKVEFMSHISGYIQFLFYKSLEKILKIHFSNQYLFLDVCKYMIYNVYNSDK